jgi:urease accessory protein UreE
MFKSLPIAKRVDRFDALSAEVLAFERDTVTLGWEDRLKTRSRRQSDGGIEYATALPRGTIIYEGDCFVFEARRIVIRVVELEEPMLVVRPASNVEWGLFAYHIGNSHQPMMIAGDAMICPDALGMDQILAFHQIPFVREHRRFTPIGQMSDHQHQLS